MILAIALLLAATTPQQQVYAFEQSLIAAVRQGDRAALERMIADGFTFVHATGGLDTKKQYIDNAVSAAQAGRAPEIDLLENRVTLFDERTVVTTSRAIVHGRGDDILLRSTHVYVRHGDSWQWAAGQSTSLPARPKARAAISAALRDAYAGRYEVAPGRVLTISADGETLKANLAGFREAELIPQSETEFAWFNPEVNIRSELIFIRDDSGKVTHAVYRRDGKEIWRAARVTPAE